MLSFQYAVPATAILGAVGYLMSLLGDIGGGPSKTVASLESLGIVGAEKLMSQKEHGTCPKPPFEKLRWNSDFDTADKICCFNRHFAEYAGYWEKTDFLKAESAASGEISFYDTITGKLLFVAPRGRTFDAFVQESKAHGWPSFRDEELVTDEVRVLPNGEVVSVDGTHLGHNLPDNTGNRYCINLVSVAAPTPEERSAA